MKGDPNRERQKETAQYLCYDPDNIISKEVLKPDECRGSRAAKVDEVPKRKINKKIVRA